MYNFKLIDDEKIKLIDDDVLIYKDNKLYTFIINNKRLLVLDYPCELYNSMEDLRISGKMNYIRMKEIIFEKNLDDIKLISNDSGRIKISFFFFPRFSDCKISRSVAFAECVFFSQRENENYTLRYDRICCQFMVAVEKERAFICCCHG